MILYSRVVAVFYSRFEYNSVLLKNIDFRRVFITVYTLFPFIIAYAFTHGHVVVSAMKADKSILRPCDGHKLERKIISNLSCYNRRKRLRVTMLMCSIERVLRNRRDGENEWYRMFLSTVT